MDLKDQIKERLSIHEVASLYVSLKPAGKYYKALCPFHVEKTPSFFVMPEKNTFNCFGCNRFGDIFTLVEEMENIGFNEAMEFLIEKFNLPVDRSRRRGGVKKDEYLQLNELALHHFRDHLLDDSQGQLAREYLRQRGISDATSEKFLLGYAPDDWQGLHRHLLSKSANLAKALELGLLIKSERGKIYDRFRGRIIFPIFSDSGSVLAFGGRAMGGDEPKYLNSPETPIYRKGDHLYGLNFCKENIRRQKSVIVVEGYLDMISLHQAGVQNAVASLGTALGDKQVYLLKRFADEVYLFFDSDPAGLTAAVRGIEKSFEQNLNPRILVSREGKDPDEFIRRCGFKAFQELLGGAVNGFRFLLDKVAGEFDLRRPEKKRQAIDAVLNAVNRIPDPIIRDEYLQQTATYFAVDQALLLGGASRPPESESVSRPLEIGLLETNIITSLLAFPGLTREVKGLFDEELMADFAAGNILSCLLADSRATSANGHAELAGRLSTAERSLFNRLRQSKDDSPMPLEKARESIIASVNKLKANQIKRHLKDINQKIKVAEKEQNMTEVNRQMQIKHELTQAFANIRKEGRIDEAS